MNMKTTFTLLTALLLAPLTTGLANADSGKNATPPTIKDQVDAAVASGANHVRITPGIYYSTTGVSLRNLSGLDIDVTGVTLILSSLSPALRIYACRDLTIRGLTIDYDPLPMTQGTIVGFGPKREWTDVKIHKGYPDPTFLANGWGFMWTSDKNTRLLKPGSANRANRGITNQGDGVWRIDHGGPVNDTAEVGDFLRIPQKIKSPGALDVAMCTNLTLIGMTFFSSPYHFCTAFRWCHGVTLKSCRIVPGPTPGGATEARLFSSVGDGFNFSGVTGGLRIEDCETDSTGDDGIAVYYSPIMVLQNDGQKVTLASEAGGGPLFPAGARLRFFVSATGKIEEATVKGCTRSRFAHSDIEEIRKKVIATPSGHQFNEPIEVDLDAPVNAQPGDEALLLDECASETIIRGCRVHNSGSRGIVANRSHLRLENNQIDSTFFPGIHVFAFFHSEGGPGFQEDVRIWGNQITRANLGHIADAKFLGGISVVRWDRGDLQFGGHRQIVIENNQIINNWGVDIKVQAATGVVIRGNRFIQSHMEKYPNNSPRNKAIIFLQNVVGATVDANEIIKPGPEIGEELMVTDEVENLNAAKPYTKKKRDVIKPDAFQPGKAWLDDRGEPIESHLGGLYYENGVYYWYGMNFAGETLKPGSYPNQAYSWMINQGITCYSSKDLYRWKLESASLSSVKDDPTHPLQPTNWVIRPKVLKCAKTGKYVMMGQLVSADFSTLNKVVVGVADKPQGPFTYRKVLDPPGGGYDITLYQDDDGKAYLICSHQWVKAHLLSDDYLAIEKTYDLKGVTGEAPAVFKHDGAYYFLTSHLTGWAPNANKYAVASTFLGPYETKGTFCMGRGADTSFDGQTTFVLPLARKPGQFIWLADRVNAKSGTEVDDFRQATHIWLPIALDPAQKRLSVDWRDQWDLRVFDENNPTGDLK